MREYIYEIDATCDLKTGEVRFIPGVKGELVRCQDCEWYQPWGDDKICMYELPLYVKPKPDDYCSKARRREDVEMDRG